MLQAKAGALAAPLAKVINDGISKPALRADAMTGLLMAACIAPAAADADALFKKEKVRDSILCVAQRDVKVLPWTLSWDPFFLFQVS